ncbi:MAG: DEAD/DEAH box helicase, partial [Chlamydiota bacterium]
MLNLRKLKQDFPPAILKEGKDLFDNKQVKSAKILRLDANTIRVSAQVIGQYENTYESEIEFDRLESETIDCDCDCSYNYDCQHLAAVLYYLESCLDEILVSYSKETDLEEVTEDESFCDEEKEKLLEAVKQAESKEAERKDEEYQKELLKEYIGASALLAKSPFFLPEHKREIERAELAVIYHFPKKGRDVEIQLALRLPSRSKPLHIPSIRQFLEAVRYQEPLYVGGKSHLFSLESFDKSEQGIARLVMDHAELPQKIANERTERIAKLDTKIFGMILAKAEEIASGLLKQKGWTLQEDDFPTLLCLFEENLESPIHFSKSSAQINISLEYIHPPTTKILLNPTLLIDQQKIPLEDARFFECAKPGIIYNHVYYRFPHHITRQHLSSLRPMREMTVPEPLFGTFVENALPEMARFGEVDISDVIDRFTTLPFVGSIAAICDLTFLNGELDAVLSFRYDKHVVPASSKKLKFSDIHSFVTQEGIVARNLVEEQKIIDDLFQDFIFDNDQQLFTAKTEKKIIEFMTDIIPRNQYRVTFNCPQNLLDQFIYDRTQFTLSVTHLDRLDLYEMQLDVKGGLEGVMVDRLWDCIISRRAYLELDTGQKKGGKTKDGAHKIPKILVLDLEVMSAVVRFFDELAIEKLENKRLERPIWSLANIDEKSFEGLPVTFKMSPKLREIRKQMLGEKVLEFTPIPKAVKAELRPYQEEGVQWLERLRLMYLNGILADDMGLGKTLQAIVALTQQKENATNPALVVCPTSLLYNWQEECHKFNDKLQTLIIDGMPNQRKKLIKGVEDYDVVITSYSLLQKDIEAYDKVTFSYIILDEAQHIKNRGTRNAKSVKMIKAEHRMVLSGTPIENSLDELWSLFDFLMPGFLGHYDRFVEKYVRLSDDEQTNNLQYLRKKVAPFIMRRMKTDVLDDLPPVSENVYHCQLTKVQKELYKSYAESARDELMKLVERDGFDKVQIHVLATLTRLKQI